MVVTTRSNKTRFSCDTLHNLFLTVIKFDEESPAYAAILENDYDSIHDFLPMSSAAFDQLQFKTVSPDDSSTIVKEHLTNGVKQKMKIFCQYARELLDDPDHPLTQKDQEGWMALTRQEFDQYRINATYTTSLNPLPRGPQNRPTLGTPKAQDDPVLQFKKGIKRDASVYPVLKDERAFDLFHSKTMATARSHDVEQVFNPRYVPQSDDDASLFAEKQRFVYAVLVNTLQTDQGRTFVREHDHDSDAQSVYAKLLTHHRNSPTSKIAVGNIQMTLTTLILDETTWKGTVTGFILHWREQIRKLDEIIPDEDRYSDGFRKTLLERAVANVTELRSVSSVETNNTALGNPALTYHQYLTLVSSAATLLDNSRLGKDRSSSKRVINHLDSYSDDLYHPEYSINHTTSIPGSATPPDTHVDTETWHTLFPWVQGLIKDAKRKLRGARQKAPTRRTNVHDLDIDISPDDEPPAAKPDDEPPDATLDTDDADLDKTESDLGILAHITKRAPMSQQDIRRILGTNKPSDTHVSKTMIINGVEYIQKIHHVQYKFSQHQHHIRSSLVDRGANGGLGGADVRVVEHSSRTADITGIDNHKIKNVPIATVAGLIRSNKGPIIAIMHQYAYTGKGTSIHSSGQLEHYKSVVDDRSRTVGGRQMIVTLDNYAIPMHIRHGLPHLDMSRPTDDDMERYPHVILTSDVDWDPTFLDNDFTEDEFANCHTDHEPYGPDNFDVTGNYIGVNQHLRDICHTEKQRICHVRHLDSTLDHINDLTADLDDHGNAERFYSCLAYPPITKPHWARTPHIPPTNIHLHRIDPNDPDYASLQRNLAWIPVEVIKKTFAATTQFSRFIPRYPFRRHFKSRNPAANVHRRSEPVATDTVYADVPAICNGSTCAQIYVGRNSLVTDIYGMKTEKQFVHTLQDNIRQRGAMDKLISDRAQLEISRKTLDILRAYAIQDWQSEPHHQHQNFAENRWATIKRYANRTLNQTGADASHWLLVLLWVCMIFNHIATPSLDDRVPIEFLTGSTPDISPLLLFTYHEPVYYSQSDASFPSVSDERPGIWVGISESVGDQLTFKILTTDTDRPTIIHRSNVRSALTTNQKNRRLDTLAGEIHDNAPIREIVKDTSASTRMATIDPDELIGRTYLTDKADGTCQRAKIVRAIEQHSDDLQSEPNLIKFLVSYDDDEKADEIIAYNEILDFIEKEYSHDLDEEENMTWKFKRISAHQGPLLMTDPAYKGSTYNVLIEWEDGSTTAEPLTIFAADDPVSCALYAKENDLLDTPSWKRFKRIAKRHKKLVRMVNQTRLKSIRRSPIYQFGFRVPRNVREAITIDKDNGTTRWRDAMTLELLQLSEYDTFDDIGLSIPPPTDYKKIRVHYVYAVKHDGRHKARLVADGHLTEAPLESVYSGVVSLRSLRIAIFLAELNGQQVFAADVGSAYLEAKTKEKVYIIADESFGEISGHTLIVRKALYGLKSSGKRYWEKFAETMVDMGFAQSEADSEVWMRRVDDLWEYICVYVDDLAIVSNDPQGICNDITDKYKYKLKGVGPIKYHLGCDFGRDKDGTLYFGPRKYAEKMVEAYKQMFGEEPPKKYHSPLERGDHPELDDSPELSDVDQTKYMSLIGQCQWLVSLGRFDIATAVMTMSRFRTAPREGHLLRVKRIYGYVRNSPHGAIRVRTAIPNYSELDAEYKIYDWANTVYGNVKEAIPHNMPAPLGKPVLTTTYKDANLLYDFTTGRSAMGVFHMLNGTPIDWFTKRQDTVETATYGSEFVAARVATDQIIDLRITLRQLGVPVMETSYLFGDNKSVVTSSTIPHSGLNKRHTALCYHRVREAVSSFLRFIHIPTGLNVADVLSKHCGHQESWHLIKPLLFWPGDTMACDTPPRTPKGTKPGQPSQQHTLRSVGE